MGRSTRRPWNAEKPQPENPLGCFRGQEISQCAWLLWRPQRVTIQFETGDSVECRGVAGGVADRTAELGRPAKAPAKPWIVVESRCDRQTLVKVPEDRAGGRRRAPRRDLRRDRNLARAADGLHRVTTWTGAAGRCRDGVLTRRNLRRADCVVARIGFNLPARSWRFDGRFERRERIVAVRETDLLASKPDIPGLAGTGPQVFRRRGLDHPADHSW